MTLLMDKCTRNFNEDEDYLRMKKEKMKKLRLLRFKSKRSSFSSTIPGSASFVDIRSPKRDVMGQALNKRQHGVINNNPSPWSPRLPLNTLNNGEGPRGQGVSSTLWCPPSSSPSTMPNKRLKESKSSLPLENYTEPFDLTIKGGNCDDPLDLSLPSKSNSTSGFDEHEVIDLSMSMKSIKKDENVEIPIEDFDLTFDDGIDVPFVIGAEVPTAGRLLKELINGTIRMMDKSNGHNVSKHQSYFVEEQTEVTPILCRLRPRQSTSSSSSLSSKKRSSNERNKLELFNHVNDHVDVPIHDEDDDVSKDQRSGYPCNLCRRPFYRLSHLLLHEPCFYDKKKAAGEPVVIGKQPWRFSCEIKDCNQEFTSMTAMRHHFDLHFGLLGCNYDDFINNLLDSLINLTDFDAIVHFKDDFN